MTFVLLIALMHMASRIVLGREFARIEEQLARDDLQRVLNDLSDEAEALASTAADWAAWDETYAFIRGRGGTFLSNNLMPDTFLTLRVSAIAFVDSSGGIVYAGGYDLRSRQPAPPSPGFLDRLAAGSRLLDLPDVQSSTRGIMIAGGRAFLVASRPITSSNRDAPIRGALVIARLLDEVEIADIGQRVRLALAFHVADDPTMDDADRRAYAALAAGSGTFTRALSAESIAAYGLIRDVDGASALLVRSVEPRTISREGSRSLLTLLLSLAGTGLVVGFVVAAFINRAVLSPLTQLGRETSRIRTAGEHAASLTHQFLAFSRKQMLQPRTIDLNGVVSDTAAMLRQLIGEHIHLVTRLAAARGGHGTRDERNRNHAGVRTVLHHEKAGKGHGTRPGGGVRDRKAERGMHLPIQHGGPRLDVRHLPPDGRGAGRGNARGRPVRSPAGGRRDDPFVRRFVVASLGNQGYRILEATNGEQALRTAADLTEKIHLLLTDVVMPVMGGAELANRLAELRPDLRVLFMSGYPERKGAEASRLPDGAIILEKPFDAGALARRVRDMLDG